MLPANFFCMKFTYYGHSCFMVQVKGKKILFDPFITGNQLAKNIDINSVEADYILVSHGHADHIADLFAIATRTKAKVVCSWEIYEWAGKQGLTNLHPMNTGGSWAFDFGVVKCAAAQHSSGLPDGSYGGNPMGFLVMSDEGNFYYSGDTALTVDMQLIPLWAKLNFAIMPIGSNFTMDITDAIYAADFVKCDTIVGVHYNTFGFIMIDADKAKKDFEQANKNLLLPEIGETIEIEN